MSTPALLTLAEEVSAKALRPSLTDILQDVQGGKVYIVTQYHKGLAALVPLPQFYDLCRLQAAGHRPPGGSMNRIVVTNLSGGEGKTTIARELGVNLSQRGYRVLLVDVDPQASLTKSLGLHSRADGSSKAPGEVLANTVLSVLMDEEAPLPSPLQAFGMDVIPANGGLSRGDSVLYSDAALLGNLRAALDRLDGYDFIILDTTPVRTALLVAAVAAADHVIVPVASGKGLTNFDELQRVVESARNFSPRLGIRLFVQNCYANTLHDRDLRTLLTSDPNFTAVAGVSTPITFRKAVFNDAMTSELMPVSYQRPTSAAAAELRVMTDEVLAAVGMPRLEAASS